METKEYFEKVMQAFRSTMSLGSSKNQHRNGRSLRKYCQDEGIDYKWLQEYKRTYAKWFDDGRFLSPYFKEARRCHKISRELLILLLSTSVQTRITINDESFC